MCLYALIQTCALTLQERRRTIAVLRATGAGAAAVARLLAGVVLALVIPAAVRRHPDRAARAGSGTRQPGGELRDAGARRRLSPRSPPSWPGCSSPAPSPCCGSRDEATRETVVEGLAGDMTRSDHPPPGARRGARRNRSDRGRLRHRRPRRGPTRTARRCTRPTGTPTARGSSPPRPASRCGRAPSSAARAAAVGVLATHRPRHRRPRSRRRSPRRGSPSWTGSGRRFSRPSARRKR